MALIEELRNIISTLFEVRTNKSVYFNEIKKLLNSKANEDIFTDFLEDSKIKVLFLQHYKVAEDNGAVSFDVFKSIESIHHDNILLCILIKKANFLKQDNFFDFMDIHQFNGDLNSNVNFTILNSLKPILENMFLQSPVSQQFLSEIMQHYSDYEFSLLQLKKTENEHLVQLSVHPLIEEFCSQPEWESHISEIRKRVDERILKELYNCLLSWTSEIQRIMQYNLDPFDAEGCIVEHAFWKNKDSALKTIIHCFKSPSALLSLRLLEESCYNALAGRLTSILVSESFISISKTYNFLNTLNLCDITRASSLDELISCTRTILYALDQHGELNYPNERLCGLAALIVKDLNKTILRLFPRPSKLSLEDFTLNGPIFKVLEFHGEFLSFLNSIKSSSKQASHSFKNRLTHFNSVYKDTLESTIIRIKQLQNLYDSFQFCTEMYDVLKQWATLNVTRQLPLTVYHVLNNIPDLSLEWFSFLEGLCLSDFSKNGKHIWDQNISNYKQCLGDRDDIFIETLRTLLSNSVTDDERIDIFVHFTHIFTKFPLIQSVHAIQITLLSKIHEYMMNERETILKTSGFGHGALRKIFPFGELSLQLMDVKKMTQKYRQYVYYTVCILGPNYKLMDSSKRIMAESAEWTRKNYASVYLSNLTEKFRTLKRPSTFLFKPGARGIGEDCLVVVDYPNELIRLSYDELTAKNLGYTTNSFFLPESNIEKSRCVKIIDESLTALHILKSRLKGKFEYNLLALYIDFAHYKVLTGLSLQWDSHQLQQYARSINEIMIVFNEKADVALDISDRMENYFNLLKNVDYNFDAFKDVLNNMRSELSKINNGQFYNTEYYMYVINQEVERLLLLRLTQSLEEFTEIMKLVPTDKEHLETRGMCNRFGLIRTGTVATLNLDIRLEDQEISVYPPLIEVRGHIYTQLEYILGVIFNQDHLLIDIIGMGDSSNVRQGYKHLLTQIDSRSILCPIYSNIEVILRDIRKFCSQWTSFQALWDTSISELDSHFRTIEQWLDFYRSFSCFRLFKTQKSFRIFPFVNVRYKFVKMLIGAKFSEWVENMVLVISELFDGQIDKLLTQIKEELTLIVPRTFENLTIVQIADLMSNYDSQASKFATFTSSLKAIQEVQKLLESHAIAIPTTVSQVVEEYDKFKISYENFSLELESHRDLLRDALVSQAQDFIDNVKLLIVEWETCKSNELSDISSNHLSKLSDFIDRLKAVSSLLSNISAAKRFLSIPETLDESYNLPFRLENISDEVRDMKAAYQFVEIITAEIASIGKQCLSSTTSDSLNTAFDQLLLKVSNNNSFRSFDCCMALENRLQNFIKINSLINQTRAEFFKERHWKSLFSLLDVNYLPSSVTLKELWDLDLIKNKSKFDDVFNAAQGEFGLASYLSSVNDHWINCNFVLSVFREKFFVVSNWSDILAKLGDHINGLEAMKSSPFYRSFTIEAEQWHERLCFLLSLSETWIEVQRKWTYLHGIFYESPEISKLLASETARFTQCTNEFYSILKRVSKDPLVLNVFKMPDVAPAFQRFLEHFTHIQKALITYLEKQRESFPRFYFVGDDDLLEILGNNSDIDLMQRHFRKMFPGVFSLVLTDDKKQIIGVVSKEKESFLLLKPVAFENFKTLIEWLKVLESGVNDTLRSLLGQAYQQIIELSSDKINDESYYSWINLFPQQIIILSEKILWCNNMEKALQNSGQEQVLLNTCSRLIEIKLSIIPNLIQSCKNNVNKGKMENLITNLVYFLNKTREIIITSPSVLDFSWLSILRCYIHFDQTGSTVKRCLVRIADGEFEYGFEYLGQVDYIIQTPLIDTCFLVLTQAMRMRLGGSPFGPAGTGKTESVKALGTHLGRFVIVFNCDANFDFKAMGRIFIGLCRVGAWGCFDEFNRLEERIISAVSQQIHTIQSGLKSESQSSIELLGQKISLNNNMCIFITMNPDYAGRSRLPNNLKQLFRSFAMTKPDRRLIAQVILYSQGFTTAERLSSKIVPLLRLCSEQLSPQPHYDFSLRALKSILVSAGIIRRSNNIQQITPDAENKIIVQSLVQFTIPKLTAQDSHMFLSVTDDIFPGVCVKPNNPLTLISAIRSVCNEFSFCSDNNQSDISEWVKKIIYLNEIIKVNHGVVLVGETCTGKTSCWRVLLTALERLDGVRSNFYVIEPKAMSKDLLYGSLDLITRSWTDGVLTSILRTIIENSILCQERHWIILDGDIDPEWVENLNSTLDDNKLLTLPNGERLCLPPSVRIIFEVSNLKHATPATISRCGMIYFSRSTLSFDANMYHFLAVLRTFNLDSDPEELPFNNLLCPLFKISESYSPKPAQILMNQRLSEIFKPAFSTALILFCENLDHCMRFIPLRALQSMFVFLARSLRELYTNLKSAETDLDSLVLTFIGFSLIWGFVSDCSLSDRLKFVSFLRDFGLNLDPNLLESYITVHGLKSWSELNTSDQVNFSDVLNGNLFVPTEETNRYSVLLSDSFSENRMTILCGPPGSGKTTLLKKFCFNRPFCQVVIVPFSSTTTSNDLLRYLLQKCEYRKGAHNMFLCPRNNQTLLVCCDELNLCYRDIYGTQSAISLLCQLLEHGGFYRHDRIWVKLERIRFVACCNPPTYIGRTKLAEKFLRHTFILYIDYPSSSCLKIIYNNFCSCLKDLDPSLPEKTASAMIESHEIIKERFTVDICLHYVFTPRDLTAWIQATVELIHDKNLSISEFMTSLLYEGIGVYVDRLVKEDERSFVDNTLQKIISTHFNESFVANHRSLVYSDWFSDGFQSSTIYDLIDKFSQKYTFSEHSLSNIHLFDQFFKWACHLNRAVRRYKGHLIMISKSGSGRKSAIDLVTHVVDGHVFKVRWHQGYTLEDFENDIRELLKLVILNEQVLMVIDESSSLPPLYFEHIYVLLGSADVSDLYPGEKKTTVLSLLKEEVKKSNLDIQNSTDLFKWFTEKINLYFHLIFLFDDNMVEWPKKVSNFSTLFKTCSFKWCGDWSVTSLCQVAIALTRDLDLSFSEYSAKEISYIIPELLQSPSLSNSLIHSLISFHLTFSKILSISYEQIPPARKYIALISQFKKLLNEKYQSIEEEHNHILTGLTKLDETFKEVARMKQELSVKKGELEIKNKVASEKLSLMATEQQRAQNTRQESMQLFEDVKIQSEIIVTKSQDIKKELAQVEPALEEAKDALSVIDRNMLNEIRVMHTPPALIKLAIGAVFELLTGHNADDWKAVKSFISKDDFISTVRNFRSESITPDRRELMNKYLSNEKFTPEQIARGSATCVPLVKWVKAHVNFNDIVTKIEPLKNELQRLENEKMAKATQASQLEVQIKDLEAKIESYKQEYSVLIREIEEIKQTLSQIERKVETSIAVLAGLEIEQSRWSESHQSFQLKKNTLLGNCLLCSGFLIYFGDFDKAIRQTLWKAWLEILNSVSINYDQNLLHVEYLITLDEQVHWSKIGLPSDYLCLENATILKHTSDYAFVIDPSGQAFKFILNLYKDLKPISTSFLNKTFKKELESAVRFGNILLVQNAEFYDPLLNNIIQRNFQIRNNRRLVTIAGQEMDLSPSFRLFLFTCQPKYSVNPTLASRLCVVNFTVTFSGLESQCLDQVFKHERPDLEEKRIELTKVQGEFNLTLYNLQKKLLIILSESKGGLLDDERVVSTLKQLNQQSIDILSKVEASNIHLAVVNKTLSSYLPFATLCSSIYFLLQDLNTINCMYHFSLSFFFNVLSSVLVHIGQPKSSDEFRLEALRKALILKLVERVLFGLLQKDRLLFLLLLSKIYLSQNPLSILIINSIDFLIQSKSIAIRKENLIYFEGFSEQEIIFINRLFTLKQFSSSADLFKNLSTTFSNLSKESKFSISCPICWDSEPGIDEKLFNSLNTLILCSFFSPSETFIVLEQFLTAVFSVDVMKIFYGNLDFHRVVFNEVSAHSPVVLLSVPGYDPGSWIDDLVVSSKIKGTEVVAMGSAESCEIATLKLKECSRLGTWLVLKNIHLTSHWIKDLEKYFSELKYNQNFRLFLTGEITSPLPSSLLRISRLLTFEPPPGVKSCLQRTFHILSEARFSQKPKERGKIYFLLAWLHALITERLRYLNLGWSKHYDFSEADLRAAFDMVDSWINRIAFDRDNLPSDKIPWAAMRSLLCKGIYGAYMENSFDSKILHILVESVFNSRFFNSNSVLVPKNADQNFDITVPQCTRFSEYLEWINELPNQQNTTWLRLPRSAEMLSYSSKFETMMNNFSILRETGIKSLRKSGEPFSDSFKQRLFVCNQFAECWLNSLPNELPSADFSYTSVIEPLARFYQREFEFACSLLLKIRSNLVQVISYKAGQIKLTSDLDSLLSHISFAKVPLHWKLYLVPSSASLNAWMEDFSTRLEHLQDIIAFIHKKTVKNLTNFPVMIGKFFFPEAFTTSLRQLCSRRHQVPLEELDLNVSVLDPKVSIQDYDPMHEFLAFGFKITGSRLVQNMIELSDDLLFDLPYIRLEWVSGSVSQSNKISDSVSLPVYLDTSRKTLLFNISFPITQHSDRDLFTQHGVAIIANTYRS